MLRLINGTCPFVIIALSYLVEYGANRIVCYEYNCLESKKMIDLILYVFGILYIVCIFFVFLYIFLGLL